MYVCFVCVVCVCVCVRRQQRIGQVCTCVFVFVFVFVCVYVCVLCICSFWGGVSKLRWALLTAIFYSRIHIRRFSQDSINSCLGTPDRWPTCTTEPETQMPGLAVTTLVELKRSQLSSLGHKAALSDACMCDTQLHFPNPDACVGDTSLPFQITFRCLHRWCLFIFINHFQMLACVIFPIQMLAWVILLYLFRSLSDACIGDICLHL